MLARLSMFTAARTVTTSSVTPPQLNIIIPKPLINISTGGLYNQPEVALNIFKVAPSSHEDSRREEGDVSQTKKCLPSRISAYL